MGLNNLRDRLCAVQISNGNGDAHIIHFPEANYDCHNLKALLLNPNSQKIFHFARFDVAIMMHYLNIEITNIFCTKISSRLTRTYTDNHGLRDICNELLNIKLNKQQQSSYWGATELSKEQIEYAAYDVLYLHDLRDKLKAMLVRENRAELAQSCFNFLPTRCKLDLMGWCEFDIFQH